ncbi:hypothetical protein LSCM1_02700 [Leishmania martiniquensis]|uniref:PROP1-like PPR domain-containing protein n=1 Tax=Leishmania martiniquensis TaxID=1580590 RepID=A0A836GCA0_9TRYP|nr:hypothetical protein LSCM1_02700 [Leishmania martiniquensis]
MQCRPTFTALWRVASGATSVDVNAPAKRIASPAMRFRRVSSPFAVQFRCLCHTFPRLAHDPHCPDATTSVRAKTLTKKQLTLAPEDILLRRVNALVGERNAAAAVQAVRAALRGSWEPLANSAETAGGRSVEAGAPGTMPTSRSFFSTKAFAAALFACEAAGDAASGLSLVAEVRQCTSRGISTDWLQAEHVLSVILRLQCMAGDRDGATRMFAYLAQHGLLRLRSASAFLQYCCSGLKDRRLAFAAYEVALKHKIELTGPDYLVLGTLCVQVREPVSTLFFMLQEMREHVSEVSEKMVCEVLEPWVRMANDDGAVALKLRGAQTRLLLHRVDAICHVPQLPAASPPPSTGGAARGTGSSSSSAAGAPPTGMEVCGICPACQAELSGYPFTASCRAHLLRELTELIVPRACRNRRAALGFEHWRRYMQARLDAGDRVDVFIDGANLGYYGLSSWYDIAKKQLMLHRGVPEHQITDNDLSFNAQCKTAGRGVDVGVNFELIDAAVQLAVSTYRMRRPLIMLHERHVEPKFMTSQSTAILQRWKQEGWLYCSPTGLNDDLCWLYGALLLTDPTDTAPTPATATTASLHRTYVCTNDKMRDHHFRLLSPRAFMRWRDRHRIAFRCARVADRTELHWQLPPPYERCIQKQDACSARLQRAPENQPTPLHHGKPQVTAPAGSPHASGTRPITIWHVPFAPAVYSTPQREHVSGTTGERGAAAVPNAEDTSAAPHLSAPLQEVGETQMSEMEERVVERQAEASEEEEEEEALATSPAAAGPWVCISVHQEAVD